MLLLSRKTGRGRTTKRVVPIYLWPDSGAWAARHPWELDVEAGVDGGREIDAAAKGKQEGNGSEERRHGC